MTDTEQTLVYMHRNWQIKNPYAYSAWALIFMNGKFTIGKLKSSSFDIVYYFIVKIRT